MRGGGLLALSPSPPRDFSGFFRIWLVLGPGTPSNESAVPVGSILPSEMCQKVGFGPPSGPGSRRPLRAVGCAQVATLSAGGPPPPPPPNKSASGLP